VLCFSSYATIDVKIAAILSAYNIQEMRFHIVYKLFVFMVRI